MIIDKGAEWALEEGHISVKDYVQVRNAIGLYKMVKDKPEPEPELLHEWHQGEAGTGKSRYVRDKYGYSLFEKGVDQWWTGYNGEENVLIEDMDKFHRKCTTDLKIWADHYPFTGRVHGSLIKIRPKRILITSQYTMDEIWEDA